MFRPADDSHAKCLVSDEQRGVWVIFRRQQHVLAGRADWRRGPEITVGPDRPWLAIDRQLEPGRTKIDDGVARRSTFAIAVAAGDHTAGH
jgi:hypothetical protein